MTAALDNTAGKTHCLPTLRGSNQRAAAPATLFRPPGHSCRKGSQTFGLIPFRILWIASAVGCQSTPRVSGALAVEDNQPSRRLALLEPETAKGNRPSCLQKQLQTGPPGDNQSHRNPDLPVYIKKNELPFKACTA